MRQFYRFICWLPGHWFGNAAGGLITVHNTVRSLIKDEPFLGTIIYGLGAALAYVLTTLITMVVYWVTSGAHMTERDAILYTGYVMIPLIVFHFVFMLFHSLYETFLEEQNKIFKKLKE